MSTKFITKYGFKIQNVCKLLLGGLHDDKEIQELINKTHNPSSK
jgi:hypothetical protein